MKISTGMCVSWLAGSSSRCARTTSPTRIPLNSTGAPGNSPRIDPSNATRHFWRCSKRLSRAMSRVGYRINSVSSAAGASVATSGGLPKATPPNSIDASESVLTCRPLASSDTAIPEMFQKRVSGNTFLSCGVSTKICTSTPRGSRISKPTTRPTSIPRYNKGDPMLNEPRFSVRNTKVLPGSVAVTIGGDSRP